METADNLKCGDSISPHNDLTNWRSRLIFIICIAMSLFQLYIAGIGFLQTPVQRAVHLGFILTLVFMLNPLENRWRWLDWILIICSVIGTGYIVFAFEDIAMLEAKPLPHEIVLGCITILAVLEAARRALGRTLPFLGLLFLIYCYYGSYAPSIFAHRGYSLSRIIQHMYLTTEGVFGVALGVSSTFIFMFILFGAFLSNGGGARLFNNMALSMTGRKPGGPAKVAIIASGLLGTINGSSIANVATTGAFTIPMMKKTGYTPEEAGAIEACASTGGQLMPPIMGAGAFIMSEFLNLPHFTIVIAALAPAMLYYLGLFMNVHFKAQYAGLQGLDEALPKLKDVLKADGHLLLPLVLIIVMLMMFYTPLKSAFYAILLMVTVCSLRKHTRMGPSLVLKTLAEGAQGAVGTGIASAVVGFIVGGSSLTALGLTLSENILDISGQALLPTLIMAMIACLLLGIGLPTTANYIVTSTVVVPALVKLQVPALSAHLFVFYFGIMADISPPVCLASFTAAGIAGGDATKTGIKALMLTLGSFLLPYAFIYRSEILLGGTPSFLTVWVIFSAAAGMVAIAAGMQAWLNARLNLPLRIISITAGFLCFMPNVYLNVAGLLLVVLVALSSRGLNIWRAAP